MEWLMLLEVEIEITGSFFKLFKQIEQVGAEKDANKKIYPPGRTILSLVDALCESRK